MHRPGVCCVEMSAVTTALFNSQPLFTLYCLSITSAQYPDNDEYLHLGIWQMILSLQLHSRYKFYQVMHSLGIEPKQCFIALLFKLQECK